MAGARLFQAGTRLLSRSKQVTVPTSRVVRRSISTKHLPTAPVSSVDTRSFATSNPTVEPITATREPSKGTLFDSGPPAPGFNVVGKVFAITGAGGGLGLTLADYLAKLGANVYCLDRLPVPGKMFCETKEKLQKSNVHGSLTYRQLDVRNGGEQEKVFAEIAEHHGRFDGLVAGAAVQYVSLAMDYPEEKIDEMMSVNFKGVFFSARAAARQMQKFGYAGSIVIVGSMSGFIANRGLNCPVYNASKAAVVQLGRSLSMEWCKIVDGKPIRVNVLCPGNIMTPMVRKNIEDEPHLKAQWEDGNMLGRLSQPEEFTGAVLYMLSDASSFMTGASLLVDGGYTAW